MTTKKPAQVGQTGKATPVMEVKKIETSKSSNADKKVWHKQPTVEELQKRIEELTNKLNAVPQDLNAKIEYFNLKKDLIRKLTRLEANATKLQEHLDEIAELAAAE